jgi:hypothetical protein
VIQAGAVIPAALVTGIRSDLPGQVTAQVTENVAYAEVFAQVHGQTVEPAKLVPSMLARFMSTDRAFVHARRAKSDVG